jgi:hypothetical protein
MLKRRILEIFLWSFMASYLTAMVFIFSSPEPRQDENTDSYQDRTNERCKDKQWECLRHWIAHDAAGFFTFCLVIVGGCQLGMFLVQLRYIRKDLVASNRPRLAVREPRILWPMSKDGCTIVNFVLQNCGGSRAHIVASALDIQLSTGGSPTLPFLTDASQDIDDTFLGAGQSIRKNFTAKTPRTDRDIVVNKGGHTDYHFLGRIAFEDDFTTRREMAFCRRWDNNCQRFCMIPGCEDEY